MTQKPRTLAPEAVASLALDSHFVRTYQPRGTAGATLEYVADVDYWYHTIYLGHDLLVDGHRDTFALLRQLRLPDSLAGRTVLDIGSAEGFFSFECEARGAERVIAVDLPEFRARRPTVGRLKRLFGSAIDLMEGDVTRVDLPTADVTLFLGVLYHLPDPFLALRRLRQATRTVMYLETHVVNRSLPALPPFGEDDPPFAVFYEHGELADDPSNWWGFNVSCLVRMLRAAGFEQIEILHHTGEASWDGRVVIRAEVTPGRA